MQRDINIVSTTDNPEVVKAVAEGKTQDEVAKILSGSVNEAASASANETAEEINDDSDPSKTEEQGEDKKPKKNNYGKRIGKLTKRLSERDREIDTLRAENAALKVGKPQTAAPDKGTETPAKVDASQEPQPDTFDTHAEYVKALSKWSARQELETKSKSDTEAQAKDAAQKDLEKRVGDYQVKAKEFAKATPDFNKVLESVDDIELSQVVRDSILKNGPDFAYALAKDPENLERICGLDRDEQIAEMAVFKKEFGSSSKETGGSSAADKAAEKKEAKLKPAPLTPVGGKNTTSTKNPEDMSFVEYKEWRAKKS